MQRLNFLGGSLGWSLGVKVIKDHINYSNTLDIVGNFIKECIFISFRKRIESD